METAILFKQHYIMSRSVQKFRFSDCDWLGFDLDHTLVRYRLHALLSLIFHSLSRFLVLHLKDFSSSSSHYPEELANVPYDQDFAAKGIVVDLDKGNFLKLNYKKRIVRAYHGLRKMDQDEIIRSYPEGIVQEFHDEPTERFKPLITFFDIPAIFLMALLVQRIDSGTCGNVSDYHQAWKDVISGFHFCFGDFQQGEYFEALRQDISRYVYKRPDVKNWLLKLRGNGIRLFLATNSHLDYADLLLKYSFGEDWRTLFDLTIVDSRKPIFFNSRTPFFCVDYESLKELDSVAPTESIQLGSIVARGNWKDLEDVFLSIDKQQKKDIHTKSLNYPLVVYFGDHLRSDVAATAKYTSWIPAAIVEELEIHSPIQLNSLEESKICDETVEEKNHMLIPDHPYRYSFLEVESSGHSEFPQSKYASQKMSTTWGSFFLHENENYVSELGHRVISRGSLAEESVDATYWNHYIREHCASSLAIPCLSILESLDLDTAFEWEKGTDFCFHIRQANDI